MPEITIVNTSPLFYLHRLGLLELLKKLYGHITVPEAVKKELKEGQAQGEDVPQLENYTWVKIRSVSMPMYLQLIADLGPGESEVLALATNHPSALVILDDKLARRVAEMQGFRLTGTAGVLLRAKQKGLVPALKPVIERLLDLDFRLKPDLVKATLKLGGEA
jgi:predicted nucleic acid-binding protein